MFRFAMNHDVTRRKFLGVTLAGGVTILVGGLPKLVTAAAATKSTFQLGGDLTVDRLGFGAMRLTGAGIWGWPPDREISLDEVVPFFAANRDASVLKAAVMM